MYLPMLIVMTVLSLVSVVGLALLSYGETRPEWRHARARHAAPMRQQAMFQTAGHGSNRADLSNEEISVRH
jgi:hypothetical protein